MNNQKSMQRVLMLTGVGLVILLIIVIAAYRSFSRPSTTPTPIVSPTITRPSPTNRPTPQLTAGEEHHTQQTRLSPEQIAQGYVPTKLASVKGVKNEAFSAGLPAAWQPVNGGNTQLSPNGVYSLNKQTNGVYIVDTANNSVARTIPVEEGTGQFNAVWLTNNHVMLTEKESQSRHLDRIYIIERTTGNKAFVAGSFPAVSRFNLDSNPRVFNNGQDVLFADNDGGLWHINILF